MNIDKQLLDNLSAQAKASPRLRMNYDLRTSPADTSQRMLNALEPGTVLPVHRHRASTEVVVMLRGRGVQWLYDDAGNVTGKVELGEGGIPAMVVEKGQWHRLECLESGTVIFEAKDGAYEPIQSGGHFVDVVLQGWLCELLQCKFLFSRSFLSFFCFTYDG